MHDKSLGQGIACDASGCIGKFAGGGLVSYVLNPDAYEEDCSRAVLVVVARGDPPADCTATVIWRALWRQRGALTLTRRDGDFIIESARPKNFDRPWSPNWAPNWAAASREAHAAIFGASGQGEIDSRTHDATPRQDDIEANQ